MCLAVPGRLVKITEEGGLRFGSIDFDGLDVTACLELTPEAHVGDFVLVHAGMALQVVDEIEAEKTLALIRELSELEQGDSK